MNRIERGRLESLHEAIDAEQRRTLGPLRMQIAARGSKQIGPALTDRPLAAPGLTSYRARGPFGWIMIGATDKAHAMREALRSTEKPQDLQIYDGDAYRPIQENDQ